MIHFNEIEYLKGPNGMTINQNYENDYQMITARFFKTRMKNFLYLTIILILFFKAFYLLHDQSKDILIESNIHELVAYRQSHFKDITLVAPKYTQKMYYPLEISTYSYDFWYDSPIQPRKLTIERHKALMELVLRVCSLLAAHEIEYMLISDTLLGSWRHWDISPWERSIKIMTNFNSYNRTLNALNVDRDLDLRVFREKNFNHDTLKITMDGLMCLIQFYELKLGYIKYKTDSKLPVIYFFPLSLRPLGKYWLPAPRNPVNVLNSDFYEMETKCGPNKTPCSDLKSRYGFVERVFHTPQICYEQLKISSITIGEIEFQN